MKIPPPAPLFLRGELKSPFRKGGFEWYFRTKARNLQKTQEQLNDPQEKNLNRLRYRLHRDGTGDRWAVLNLVSLGQASDAILRENYRSILAAENMIDALERQDSGVLLLFLGDPITGKAQFWENETRFLEWLARARNNITVPGEGKLIQDIEDGYVHYRGQFSEWIAVGIDSGSPAPALHRYYSETASYPPFARVRRDCRQLRHLNESAMYKASERRWFLGQPGHSGLPYSLPARP